MRGSAKWLVSPALRETAYYTASQSYHMPAEWHLHSACWMLWPHGRNDNWKGNGHPAQLAYTDVIKAISKFEPVNVGVSDRGWESATASLGNLPRVSLVPMECSDSWIRDSGPTFLIGESKRLGAIMWKFNNYGLEEDSSSCTSTGGCEIASAVAKYANADDIFTAADFVLEGGSIHVDGEGTLITTEECLLNPNRNAQLTKAQIEDKLKLYLGVQRVIWLPKGLIADVDTSGHCFTAPGKLVLAWSDDQSDEQYSHCREAMEILTTTHDAKGRPFEVRKLICPPKMYYTEADCEDLEPLDNGEKLRRPGTRLAASYVNYYLANGGIVMPAFGAPSSDQAAMAVLSECFPGYEITPVYSRDILLGGGNIHCITQQQPVPN